MCTRRDQRRLPGPPSHISCIRRGATLAVTEMLPLPTQEHQGDALAIVAADRRRSPSARADQIGAALDVAGGVLDADDIGHLRQAQRGVVGQVGHRAAGHVVEDQRQIDRFGDLAEMPVQTLLRRLVVVRHHRQTRAAPAFLAYSVSSIASAVEFAPVPAMTGMRPAACSTATRISSQCSSQFDRRRFAGGADDDDGVGAFAHVPVDQASSGGENRALPSSCIGVTMATMEPVIMGEPELRNELEKALNCSATDSTAETRTRLTAAAGETTRRRNDQRSARTLMWADTLRASADREYPPSSTETMRLSAVSAASSFNCCGHPGIVGFQPDPGIPCRPHNGHRSRRR